MNIWILQTAEPLVIDKVRQRPMRAMLLANQLLDLGHSVTIWSSDFSHYEKKHRFNKNLTIRVSKKLTINLFTSRGYGNHKGIARFLDHIQMANNLRKMLKSEPKPDLAFIGFPPIEVAWVMAAWLKRKNVHYMLDVKDAWPDQIVQSLHWSLRGFARILLIPQFMMSKYTFKNAHGLSSITDEFLHWSLGRASRPRNSLDTVAPVTCSEFYSSDEETRLSADFWDKQKVYDDESLRIFFVGSLTNVFDFGPLVFLARSGMAQVVIAGEGPAKEELLSYVSSLENLIVPGWISPSQIKELAKRSKFSIAPYRQRLDFEMSIPNKIYDALSLGKPILTSLNGPVGKLIETYSIGVLYNSHKKDSLSIEIAKLKVLDLDVISVMGKNARDLYEKSFQANAVYYKLANDLIRLGKPTTD